jgi:hypothetical protein
VCASGVCDPQDNLCGLAAGQGTCANDDQCRNDSCDSTTAACAAGCASDEACDPGDYCKSDGSCSPKLPTSSRCAATNQCQSGDCVKGVCNTIVGSGAGLLCAVRSVGSSSSSVPCLFGIFLVASGLARRRRRVSGATRQQRPLKPSTSNVARNC